MSEPGFPKQIFVVRETDRDEEFLVVYESELEAAEKDGKVIVGVYQLRKEIEVTLEVKVEPKGDPPTRND
jgi:hypothetical protein